MATDEWNSLDSFSEEFPNYNCAFLDILGYKNRATAYFENTFNLFGRLNRALDTTATGMNLTAPLLNTHELRVEIVSDSIIITQPASNSGLGTLLPYTAWFCSTLGMEGLFVRGGIARGPHARKTTRQGFDFLASEALQKAYLLESKSAIYPRVLVDSALVEDLPGEEKRMLIKEGDEFIVDFAHNLINREGNNFDDVFGEMTELVEVIIKERSPSVCAKLQWLLDYYYWTIQQSPNWDDARFAHFPSHQDRLFQKLSS